MLSVLTARINKAIQHFKYGITHDIFEEPVITYAKLAISALEKTIPTPVDRDSYGVTYCPKCHNHIWEYITESTYCSKCGQRLTRSHLDKYKYEFK